MHAHRSAPPTHLVPPSKLYDIRSEDQPLIAAAIGLGEWIMACSHATPAQRAAVAQALDALRALPAAPAHGFGVDFGIRIEPADPSLGHAGAWSVEFSRVEGALEIGGGCDDDRSLEWIVWPGRLNRNDSASAIESWIGETRNPSALVRPGCMLVIDAAACLAWA